MNKPIRIEALSDDADLTRAADLARMQRMATGLLVAAALVYAASSFYESMHWSVGFVVATAEAAMVGAIADWFAVTALFRRPLGLPIPHTGIIPRKKDAIASQFGEFVTANFLSEEVIGERLRGKPLARGAGRWLQRSHNAATVARQVTTGIAGVVRVIDDAAVQELIDAKVASKVRDTQLAPLLGDVLDYVLDDSRRQDILSAAIRAIRFMLKDHRWMVREKIMQQTPWWFPDSLDRAIYERLMNTAYDTLIEVDANPEHPLRESFETMLDGLLDRLRSGDDMAEKEAALKEELLAEPAVRDFTQSLWGDVKQSLLAQMEDPDEWFENTITQAVVEFGRTVEDNSELAARIDGWIVDGARYVVRTYGDEVSRIIAHTIEGWDAEATSRRIELQIGRDLQFIRINGTVVGGLAGFTIHLISVIVASA